MTRLTKSTGGAVFVDKSDILDDIIETAYAEKPQRYTLQKYNQTAPAEPRREIQKRLLKEKYAESLERQNEQVQENVARSLLRKSQNGESRFVSNSEDVERAKHFLDDIEKNLKLVEETKRSKVRRQFEEWNKNVHGSIMSNIVDQINMIDSKALNRKKNDDYANFLDITNKKAAIFRDIIIESEYDPLEPNRRAIKAKTRRLKDPTKIEVQKAESESSMLGGGSSGRVRQRTDRGREVLPLEHWASGKIEATPHGVFAKLMDTAHGNKSLTQTFKSTLILDHFNFPKGKGALDPEMPVGKRCDPRGFPFLVKDNSEFRCGPTKKKAVLPPRLEKTGFGKKKVESYRKGELGDIITYKFGREPLVDDS